MPFIRKIPWPRLTRVEVPPMVVIRRPLAIDSERTLEVGASYPAPEDRRALTRCRQYYEMRRIAPAPPVATQTEPTQTEQPKRRNHGTAKK